MTKRLPSAKHPRMKPGVPKPKKSGPPKGKPFTKQPKFKHDEAGSKPPRRAFERSDSRTEKPFRSKDKFAPRPERGLEKQPYKRGDSEGKPERRSFDRSAPRGDKPFRSKEKFPPRRERSFDKPSFDRAGNDAKPVRKSYDRATGRGDKPFRSKDNFPPRRERSFDKPSFDRAGSDTKPERKSYDRSAGRGDKPFRSKEKFSPRADRSDARPSYKRADADFKPTRRSSERSTEIRKTYRSSDRYPRETDRRYEKPDRSGKFGERKFARDGDRKQRSRSFDGDRRAPAARAPKFEPRTVANETPAENKLFRVYGRRPVAEILKLGIATRVDLIHSAHGRVIDDIKQLVNEQQLDLRVMTAEEFSPHEDLVEQSVCAYAPPPELRHDLKTFLRELDAEQQETIVMLDGILDPHNFGAILRTAAAARVRAVIIRDHRQAPLTETVVKASAGMAYLIPIFEVTNLSAAIRDLAKAGFWSAAASGTADAVPYDEFDWNRNINIILGSEGKGVSQLLRDEADVTVSIPLAEQVDSLNVSVATGVLLFEVGRQRRANSDE